MCAVAAGLLLCTQLLQQGVAAGLTLHDIGLLMTRREGGASSRPCALELAVATARRAALRHLHAAAHGNERDVAVEGPSNTPSPTLAATSMATVLLLADTTTSSTHTVSDSDPLAVAASVRCSDDRTNTTGACEVLAATVATGGAQFESQSLFEGGEMTDAVWRYHDAFMAVFPTALQPHIDAALASSCYWSLLYSRRW